MLTTIKRMRTFITNWFNVTPKLQAPVVLNVLRVMRLEHDHSLVDPGYALDDELCFFRVNGDVSVGDKITRFSALGTLWDIDNEIRMVYVEHELLNGHKEMGSIFQENFFQVYDGVIWSDACRPWVNRHMKALVI